LRIAVVHRAVVERPAETNAASRSQDRHALASLRLAMTILAEEHGL
jgi:hypothetical protein